ncbi:Methylmalonic aciduria and homocystinuria type D-like protein, mitochondrial [Smittium culicis]|uniref:Methylmalonic aciduria and homocystinuria type D-like protein, mitochondrial n=1 Tax=Smittium culicis TaxID=133412 RepID=A0A1R1Y2Q4_9FUNG|nr:Methylmalonic aciduria and homocystinuria type D-like protein, mitochondrial [Smittium culicis]
MRAKDKNEIVEPKVYDFELQRSDAFEKRFNILDTGYTSFRMQYSIYKIPRQFKSEIKLIFPSLQRDKIKDLLIIPTFQKTFCSLVEWGEDTKNEKDSKLLNFYAFGYSILTKLSSMGYWFDIICPASGLPVFTTSGSTIYSEVDCCKKLLNYNTVNVGMCNVISHPEWALSNYPATAFTTAPEDVILSILDSFTK